MAERGGTHRNLGIAAAGFLLLLGLPATGCRRAPAAPPVQRLIEGEPAEIFRSDRLTRSEVVRRWSLDSPDDLRDWEVEGAEGLSATLGGGVTVLAARNPVSFSRWVELEAEEIDAFEVDLPVWRRGRFSLRWTDRADGRFSRGGEASLKVSNIGKEPTTATFAVSHLPEWHGSIRRIRLISSRRRMVIREIRAVRLRHDPAELAAAIGRGWKVRFGSEVRTARLAPPGVPIEWPVNLGPESRLRLAYGIGAATSATIRFRVSARRPESDPVTIFEEYLSNGDAGPAGWRERTVELAGLAAGAWTLLLESEVEEGRFDPTHGFPAWGHPEILGPASDAAAPNILLVSVDTLRPDHLGVYGYPRPTSPGLDAWARRAAAIFGNVITTTPSTLHSHASMFSGRWSLGTGVSQFGKVGPQTALLAESLRGAGFTTRAVTGGGWLHPRFGFSRGFDVYRFWADRRMAERELAEGVAQVESWLRQGPGSPFFLFLHTFEVHSPFRPRQPFLERIGGPAADAPAGEIADYHRPRAASGRGFDMIPVRQRPRSGRERISDEELSLYYDAGIGYADRLLAGLLAVLEETGLDRRTIVVVTSDHGESLGEQGLYGHGHLHDTNLKVPLLIAVPDGKRAGEHIPEQASLVDLMPTLLELAGVPAPDGLDGSSLVGLLEGRDAAHRPEAWSYARRAGLALRISNRLKYLYDPRPLAPEPARERLFRLQQDPGEENDLAATAAETPRLRERVRAFLRRSHRGLRMSFENSGQAAFRGSLRGDVLLYPSAVMTPEMSCPCLTWERIGEPELEVPPGERFELLFDSPGARELRLSGAVEGGRLLDETVDLTTLGRARRWSLDGGAGRRTGLEADGGSVEIAVWWEGGLAAAKEPDEPDPALVQQLRDLGYLQ